MSDAIEIPTNEREILRLFALDDQLAMEIAHSGVLDQLWQALGTPPLHGPDVQIVKLPDIADMGLPDFLAQAYDIDAAEIATHSKALNAQTGTIALIRSGAFQGQAHRLTPTRQARLIAAFNEPGPDWRARPMPERPLRRQSPRAARARARRIGLSLFTVMMTLIILFVVWLAT